MDGTHLTCLRLCVCLCVCACVSCVSVRYMHLKRLREMRERAREIFGGAKCRWYVRACVHRWGVVGWFDSVSRFWWWLARVGLSCLYASTCPPPHTLITRSLGLQQFALIQQR